MSAAASQGAPPLLPCLTLTPADEAEFVSAAADSYTQLAALHAEENAKSFEEASRRQALRPISPFAVLRFLYVLRFGHRLGPTRLRRTHGLLH